MFYYKITFTVLLGVTETLYVSVVKKLTRQHIAEFMYNFKYEIISYSVETL